MAKKREVKSEASEGDSYENGECFIIMPIADCDGYEKGHFSKVYEDIFKPACLGASFKPVRADEVKQTNLIHLDILQKLIDSPMAICDLSSRNPNVLFELGLRQAFDKPTVLVQEIGTPKIFDIAPLRYTEYRKELKYREVLEDQESLSEVILATKEATDRGEGVNSIVNILSLAGPATLKEVSDQDSSKLLQLVRAEMSEMRNDFRYAMKELDYKASSMPKNSMHNASRRIREAKMFIDKAMMRADETNEKSEAIDLLNRAQSILIRILESDTPMKIRDEAKHMLMMSEDVERHIIESK